ncbi:MAG: glycoside hydrolase family 30 protein [Clostridia bacterium]|nr:glycoside hydrolase family 30 protein [Clostridia bacterium]
MIISTTEKNKWQKGKTTSKEGIKISFGDEKQNIRGFGTCFSELGAIALNKLSTKEKNELLDELFTEEGANFNYCRTPIGASDFATDFYSYNETDGDYEMKNFSVERDEKYLLPLIREALYRQKDMQMFASPWCPPLWLKTIKVYSNGIFNATPENFKAYALYFKKYVEAYHSKGVPIIHIHPQNEPCSNQVFPSCVWSGEMLTRFIGDYLGEALKGTGVDIFYGTVNGPEGDERWTKTRYHQYLGYAMQDEKARKYIKGVGYQWAGKMALGATHDDYPELELIQTESECGRGDNSWAQMMYIFEMMRMYIREGASAYVYWNIALEGDGSSTWGWKQNSLIHVQGNKATLTPEFYLMKHVSHFVKRGARFVESKGEFSSNTLAFVNPDGGRVLFVANPYETEKIVTVEEKSYALPPRSLNTITL